MAANNDVTIPIIKVVAKPFTGPVPKIYRIIPVIKVVTFASKIEESAPLKPSSMASFKCFPIDSSS